MGTGKFGFTLVDLLVPHCDYRNLWFAPLAGGAAARAAASANAMQE